MYYENLLKELFFFVTLFGVCFAIILTAIYWIVRTVVASVGYEAKRAGKALKNWANE